MYPEAQMKSIRYRMTGEPATIEDCLHMAAGGECAGIYAAPF